MKADTTSQATFGKVVTNFCLRGLSKGQAVTLAAKHFPHLHRAYREAGCIEPLTAAMDEPGNFPALVQAQQKHGRSKAEAVAFCVSTFPEVHAAWRASGDTSNL